MKERTVLARQLAVFDSLRLDTRWECGEGHRTVYQADEGHDGKVHLQADARLMHRIDLGERMSISAAFINIDPLGTNLSRSLFRKKQKGILTHPSPPVLPGPRHAKRRCAGPAWSRCSLLFRRRAGQGSELAVAPAAARAARGLPHADPLVVSSPLWGLSSHVLCDIDLNTAWMKVSVCVRPCCKSSSACRAQTARPSLFYACASTGHGDDHIRYCTTTTAIHPSFPVRRYQCDRAAPASRRKCACSVTTSSLALFVALLRRVAVRVQPTILD